MRRLRENADLSGKDLAERLGWAASKVSRLENGKQTATVDDVDIVCAALGVSDPVRDDLVEDLRSLRVEYATWQRQLRTGFAGRQRVARLLDNGSVVLRALQTALVPGLLQTADYARDVFRLNAAVHGPRDVEAAVRERMRRQDILHESGRDLRFLITESALRARLCGRAEHRTQLDRLLILSGLPSVRIAVLPSSAEPPHAVLHSFDLFDNRLVLVETLNAELAVRDPEDVALYARLFDLFWDAAVEGEGASAVIARVARDLPT